MKKLGGGAFGEIYKGKLYCNLCPCRKSGLKMIARKDVVYTLGGIVNHDGGRLNQDKCNLLTYFFSVEKRKTGEYLAAKVVS